MVEYQGGGSAGASGAGRAVIKEAAQALQVLDELLERETALVS